MLLSSNILHFIGERNDAFLLDDDDGDDEDDTAAATRPPEMGSVVASAATSSAPAQCFQEVLKGRRKKLGAF